MSPVEESEESTGIKSDKAEDTDSSEDDEDDEDWFEEQQYDVYSVALTVTTTELYQFPAIQLVSLVNHPVLAKDAYEKVCIAEFGYRLFVNICPHQKVALCNEISKSGVTVKPHTSRLVFIRGRCTIGLYALIRALVATNINNTLLIAYSKKISYAECLFLDHFDGPNQTRRFDIGRNVDTCSIPIFGITKQNSGDKIFPMFGNMGTGYGSILHQIPSSNNQVESLTLKCYPRILHHLKATGITMDMPNTNYGMRTKLSKIADFITNIGKNIGGYRYEFVFYTTQQLCQCYQMVADYQTIAGVPSELEIALTFTPQVY